MGHLALQQATCLPKLKWLMNKSVWRLGLRWISSILSGKDFLILVSMFPSTSSRETSRLSTKHFFFLNKLFPSKPGLLRERDRGFRPSPREASYSTRPSWGLGREELTLQTGRVVMGLWGRKCGGSGASGGEIYPFSTVSSSSRSFSCPFLSYLLIGRGLTSVQHDKQQEESFWIANLAKGKKIS